MQKIHYRDWGIEAPRYWGLLAVLGLGLSLVFNGAGLLVVRRFVHDVQRRSSLLKIAIIAPPALALALTLAVALPGVSDLVGVITNEPSGLIADTLIGTLAFPSSSFASSVDGGVPHLTRG